MVLLVVIATLYLSLAILAATRLTHLAAQAADAAAQAADAPAACAAARAALAILAERDYATCDGSDGLRLEWAPPSVEITLSQTLDVPLWGDMTPRARASSIVQP